jgi:PhnB protein
MSIQAYIYFNGNCREAVEFYANVFQTNQPQFMLYGDFYGESDFEHNEADKKLVMHTNLIISGSMVMFSDVHSGMPFIQGNNIGLTVLSKDENEIRSVYEKLKEGGTIIMEPQETFWSKCFANVTDKYGISWQLSLESEQVK